MSPAPLHQAHDVRLYGGKAVSLGVALRAGLPVPDGLAIDIHRVRALASGEKIEDRLLAVLDELLAATSVAVRSSAVEEDSTSASFAGQHLSRLHVTRVGDVFEAIEEVYASAHSASAISYRQRMNVQGAPSVAVVVQTMVVPESAGVLFTRNPINGADERVVEGAWGLGEAVVSGLITPDCWRMGRGGEIREYVPGDKDLEILPSPGGGTTEVEVLPERAAHPCLTPDLLCQLDQLATACERHFGPYCDIEWAVSRGRIYLLQCRPITR